MALAAVRVVPADQVQAMAVDPAQVQAMARVLVGTFAPHDLAK